MGLGIRFRARMAVDRLHALVSVPLECAPGGISSDHVGRVSPRDSLRFAVGGRPALLCYGRPSANGRRVFGDLVPYGELWRMGANEPTVLHLPFSANVAGVRVRRGKLSLYAIPSPSEWTIVLNRATNQWGLTRPERGRDGVLYGSAYTALVEGAELGRTRVGVTTISHVEQLTVRAREHTPRGTELLREWETTQVVIAIELSGDGVPTAPSP